MDGGVFNKHSFVQFRAFLLLYLETKQEKKANPVFTCARYISILYPRNI